MAGGGIKKGIVYGETDDFSYNVVENPVHIHDLNATILHCLGIDHRRLSFKFQGLDMRLTGVEEHSRSRASWRESRPRGDLVRRFRMLLWFLPAVLTALIAIVAWNAIAFTSKQTRVQPVVAIKPLPGFEERLAHSLRFPTISSAADGGDAAQAFEDLHGFLRTSLSPCSCEP